MIGMKASRCFAALLLICGGGNGIQLQLNGRNLADERYYLSGGEGSAVGLPAPPRLLELTVSWGTGVLRR